VIVLAEVRTVSSGLDVAKISWPDPMIQHDVTLIRRDEHFSKVAYLERQDLVDREVTA
jgi:hypothetical protein